MVSQLAAAQVKAGHMVSLVYSPLRDRLEADAANFQSDITGRQSRDSETAIRIAQADAVTALSRDLRIGHWGFAAGGEDDPGDGTGAGRCLRLGATSDCHWQRWGNCDRAQQPGQVAQREVLVEAEQPGVHGHPSLLFARS